MEHYSRREKWKLSAEHLLDEARAISTTPQPGWRVFPGVIGSSGPQSDALEGFARTYLLWALASEGGALTQAEAARYWEDSICEGLARGPLDGTWKHPYARSQEIAEASSIALSILISKGTHLAALGLNERSRLFGWLRSALESEVHRSNWLLFHRVIAATLKQFDELGQRGQAQADRARRGVESLYAGEGWFRDGKNAAYDYYNAWSFHFYPGLLAHLTGDASEAEISRARLNLFLPHFLSWFSSDGEPLVFGRSLTYRYACVAPFGVSALLGGSVITPQSLGRAATATLSRFEAESAGGLATPLGWFSSAPQLLQAYSGASSPYWVAKAYVCLLLGEDDLFWRDNTGDVAQEESLPRVSNGMIVCRTESGAAILVNHGSQSPTYSNNPGAPVDRLYSHLEYSSRSEPLGSGFGDNSLGIYVEGKPLRVRRDFSSAGWGPTWAASSWIPRKAQSAAAYGWSRRLREIARRLRDALRPRVISISIRFDDGFVHVHRLPWMLRRSIVRQSGRAYPGHEPTDRAQLAVLVGNLADEQCAHHNPERGVFASSYSVMEYSIRPLRGLVAVWQPDIGVRDAHRSESSILRVSSKRIWSLSPNRLTISHGRLGATLALRLRPSVHLIVQPDAAN